MKSASFVPGGPLRAALAVAVLVGVSTRIGAQPASPGPGDPPVPASPVVQAASVVGCANPMIGRNTETGSGRSAVFVDIREMRTGADPVYDRNAVFWTSRQNKPGQSVLMSGAFTGNPKTVRLAALRAGQTDWQAAVRESQVTVPARNMSSTGLTFTVPPQLPYGPIAYRIEDQNGSVPALEGLVNRPELQWIVGTPPSEDSVEAPRYQLHNCGAVAGGKLRLFGKNIPGTQAVYLQSADNQRYTLGVESSDDTAVVAAVPPGLAAGVYYVWVGSPEKDATASVPVKVDIHPAPPPAAMVSCPGLNGDGVTDNAAALQACFDRNRKTGVATIFRLPAGQFAIGRAITLHPWQYLTGESEDATVLVGKAGSAAATPAAWVLGSQYFGLQSLTLRGPHRDGMLRATSLGSDPRTHGHVLVNRVRFAITADYTQGQESAHAIKVSGPDIRILNSAVSAKSAIEVIHGDGVLISGMRSDKGLYAIASSQNVIITRNVLGAADGLNEGVVIGASRPMISGTTANATRNLYVGYNLFRNMTYAPTNQFFTTDGGGGAYLGRLASASSGSVTLAGDPNWNMVGTSNPENVAISIVAGTGVGQYRFLKSIKGRVLELVRPWDVVPDGNSVVDVTNAYTHIAVSHNEFRNMHGHALNSVLFFGGVFDSVIDNNYNLNAGNGIAVAAYGPYGENTYLPTFNIDVLDNTVMEDGEPNFLKATALNEVSRGIAVQGMPGAALSGILVRGNRVGGPGRIFFPNSFKDNYSVLVEHNEAMVEPWHGGSYGPPGALIRGDGM